MIYKILIGGDGGQGVQLMSDVIAKAAFENGREVTSIPNYGLEQRGGVSLAFIKISDQKIVYPKFSTPDTVVILSNQARERMKNYIENSVGGVFDFKNFSSIFEDKKIDIKSLNIFLLGIIAHKLNKDDILRAEYTKKCLQDKIGNKPNWELNETAFAAGLNFYS